MNHPITAIARHRLLLAFAVVCIQLASPAFAQLSPEQKKGAIGTRETVIIDDFVKDQFTHLNDPDPAIVSKARDNVVAEARGGLLPYNVAYAKVVSAHSVSFLNKNKDLRSRINCGVVVAKVAAEAKQASLDAPTFLLLKDDNQAIKLWGLKAAKSIIAELVSINQHKPMVAQIIPIAQKFPANGAIIMEAYDVLTPAEPTTKIVSELSPELLKLTKWRCEQYKTPGGPDYPVADEKPIIFLTSSKVWPNLDAGQKDETMQSICTLLKLGAHHGDHPARPELREQYEVLISRTGGSLSVVGQQVPKDQALEELGKRIQGAAASAPSFTKLVEGTCQAIMSKYPAVQEPAAPAAPTTAATP